MKRIFLYFLLMLFIFVISSEQIYAKRGCCSHHGGVAYCGKSGKYICNDGTTSPTCTCSGGVSSSSSSKKSTSSNSSSAETKKTTTPCSSSSKKNSSSQGKQNNTNQKQSTTSPVKTPKSNVATLSKLTINGEEIFVADEMRYTTQEEKVTVSYVPTDSKASVKLEQSSELVEGDNLIKLIVTAEDGKTKKNYTLVVFKEKKKDLSLIQEYQKKEIYNFFDYFHFIRKIASSMFISF